MNVDDLSMYILYDKAWARQIYVGTGEGRAHTAASIVIRRPRLVYLYVVV
jgi:hypothetical protein